MTDNSTVDLPASLGNSKIDLSKQISKLSKAEKLELLETLEELDKRESRQKMSTFFTETGPFRRELYPKQIEFFRLGKTYNERALLGGNRSGKTVAGGFEMACHLTGLYPNWWEGKTFDHPIDAWSCGDIAKNVRDITQALMLGSADAHGTGMIPGDLIVRTTVKHGLADAVESVFVKHVAGGNSMLQFKSYDQGREAFQGVSCHAIHLDEECPMEIYTECLLRTMTVDGIIYLTATPLLGLTDIMLAFLPHLAPAPEDFATQAQ